MIQKFIDINKDYLINSDHEKMVIERVIMDLTQSKKGVLIHGNYGAGKSLFFKGYIKLLEENKFYPPKYTSIEKIISDIMVNKMPKIENRALIIDEFGSELDKNLVFFGTNIKEIIINFMILRYELFQDTGIKTHISTNINPIDFAKFYGIRIFDRFIEMFNFHNFDWKSKRS